MKKIVKESLNEYLISQNEEPLNEISLEKIKSGIKIISKKIGDFFVGIFNGKILDAINPINIGIMVKKKILRKINYYPSIEDIKKDSSLISLRNNFFERMLQRAYEDFEKISERNRRNKNISKKFYNGDYDYLLDIALKESQNNNYNNKYKIYEEDEEDEYIPTDYPKHGEKYELFFSTDTKKLKEDILEYYEEFINAGPDQAQMNIPIIFGAPGVGKTAIIHAFSKTTEGMPRLRVIDVPVAQMSPDDWTMPTLGRRKVMLNLRTKETRAYIHKVPEDTPKGWLPMYKPTGDPEEDAALNDWANGGDGGIIFLDEITRASAELQNTLLKIIRDRRIGEYVLGSKWIFVAAANRMTDDPTSQTELSAALATRANLIAFRPSIEEWLEWEKNLNDPPDAKKIVADFVDLHREHFYRVKKSSQHGTTLRSWEHVIAVLRHIFKYGDLPPRDELMRKFQGVLDPLTCYEFVAYLSIMQKWPKEVLLKILKDPDNAPLPEKTGEQYKAVELSAIVSCICSFTRGKKLSAEEVENFVKYLIRIGSNSLANKALVLFVEVHPYISYEMGEKGQKITTYKKAMDLFRAAYRDPLFLKQSKEEIMSQSHGESAAKDFEKEFGKKRSSKK